MRSRSASNSTSSSCARSRRTTCSTMSWQVTDAHWKPSLNGDLVKLEGEALNQHGETMLKASATIVVMPKERERMIALPASMRVFERGWLSSNNVLFIDDARAPLWSIPATRRTHRRRSRSCSKRSARRSLDLIVNTHLHSDHCGGNALLQATFACDTLIPANGSRRRARLGRRRASRSARPARPASASVSPARSRPARRSGSAASTGPCSARPATIRIR